MYSSDKSSDYQVHAAAMPDADGVSFLDGNWSLLADAQCSGTGAESLSLTPSQISLVEQETRAWPNPEGFSPDLKNAMTQNFAPIEEELSQHDVNEV